MVSVLILGASYGSLLAIKLLMAKHRVTLVCTAPTAALINKEGIIVRFPVRGRDDLVEIASRALPDAEGLLDAAIPDDVDVSKYDLAVLGMQEPQYGEPDVSKLLARLAQAKTPALAIMNMPPLPYLKRIPDVDAAALSHAFAAPAAWDAFEPGLVSLASPDPQAFRPPDEPKNVLQVGLPTNFKAAPFADARHTALLRALEADILSARFAPAGESEAIEILVKLRVHDSLFVPLAKWPMLLTGNYRCWTDDGAVPIERAVHGDLELSRGVYSWVCEVCEALGAAPDDLVPFQKYADAAANLKKPSSVARALAGGAANVERVDALVAALGRGLGKTNEVVDATVARVDARLAANRAAAS
jgi:hypothetical protein